MFMVVEAVCSELVSQPHFLLFPVFSCFLLTSGQTGSI